MGGVKRIVGAEESEGSEGIRKRARVSLYVCQHISIASDG
jgi:hypothetical protein